jgi:hypothetical protein
MPEAECRALPPALSASRLVAHLPLSARVSYYGVYPYSAPTSSGPGPAFLVVGSQSRASTCDYGLGVVTPLAGSGSVYFLMTVTSDLVVTAWGVLTYSSASTFVISDVVVLPTGGVKVYVKCSSYEEPAGTGVLTPGNGIVAFTYSPALVRTNVVPMDKVFTLRALAGRDGADALTYVVVSAHTTSTYNINSLACVKARMLLREGGAVPYMHPLTDVCGSMYNSVNVWATMTPTCEVVHVSQMNIATSATLYGSNGATNPMVSPYFVAVERYARKGACYPEDLNAYKPAIVLNQNVMVYKVAGLPSGAFWVAAWGVSLTTFAGAACTLVSNKLYMLAVAQFDTAGTVVRSY